MLVQDGTRVRAVALRFERIDQPPRGEAAGFPSVGVPSAGGSASGTTAADAPDAGREGGAPRGGYVHRGDDAEGWEWRCTALQFG